MDWKTKLVLPPNYVTLQHLKELRMKEKADLELKLREEAEAEHNSRLEEEEKVRRLKEEEEKRRVEEEMRLKEEEEKKMREKEEEERLRREIVRREQIIRTRTVLCGDEEDEEKEEEPSRITTTRRKDFKKRYLEEEGIKEEIVVSEGKQEENLIPLKKMREKEEEERLRREIVRREQIIRTRTILCGDEEDEEKEEPSRRTARRKDFKKNQEQKEKLEIKQEEIVVSEGKQEEKLEIKQVEISRTSRRPRRDFKKSQELLLKDQNQEEEIKEEIKEEIVVSEGKQVENLEEGKKKKKNKWRKNKKKVETLGLGSQEVNETLKSETKSIEEEVILDTKPNGIIKDRRQRKFGYRGIAAVDKVVMNQKVEEIEKKIGDLNVVDVKMKSKAEKPTSQMKKKVYEKEETLELESVKGISETLKSETKSSEEELILDTKPNGIIYKDRRQRKFECKGNAVVDKVVTNQKIEEIEKKIGDLNLDKKKKIMKSKAEKQFQKVEEIEKTNGYLNVNVNVVVDEKMKAKAEKPSAQTQVKIDKQKVIKPKDAKQWFPQPQMSYVNRYPHSQIKNFNRHGKRIDSSMNPRNASSSSLLWVPKTVENQIAEN